MRDARRTRGDVGIGGGGMERRPGGHRGCGVGSGRNEGTGDHSPSEGLGEGRAKTWGAEGRARGSARRVGVSRAEVSLGQGVTHRGSRPFPALLLPKLLQQLLHRLGRSGAGGTWGCARGVRGSPGCRGALKTSRTPPNAQASCRSPCLIQTLGGPPDLLRPLKPPCRNRAPRDPQTPGSSPSEAGIPLS